MQLMHTKIKKRAFAIQNAQKAAKEAKNNEASVNPLMFGTIHE